MPRQPGDARRTNVISLVIRPIGPPPSIGDLKYVQPLMRGAPQALLGGESVEVEIGELPRRVELPDQVATGFVGHRLSSPEGSSAVLWSMRAAAAAERQLQRLARGKGGPLGEKLLTLVDRKSVV